MRERTTWNRSAAQMKKADPYLMNQDHVSQQPSADDYVIGDPSTFAEDIHPSKDTWEAEYAGGQVKRNEIGMADMRKDTFNHPEKTAADHGLLLKKADLCIKTASMMVGAAGDAAVEDQAVALMHMPDADLINTFNRLANGPQAQVAGQQTVAQQVQAQAMQAQECLANGDVQAAQGCMATMMQQAQECMAQGDVQAAQECLAQVQQVKAAIEAAQQGQAPVAGGMWAGKLAQQKEQGEKKEQEPAKEQESAKAQGQQKKQAQQDEQGAKEQGQGQKKKADQIQTAVQQAVAQAMASIQAGGGQTQVAQAVGQAVAQAMAAIQAGQMPMAQQAPMAGQMPMAQQEPVAFEAEADDAALADMLMMEPGDAGLAEMGIEMEPSPMDAGEMGLGPEDDVLMTLFAAEQGEKKEQEPAKEQGQQGKTAMARTASTRTVGTRPTQGVSRVGGGLGGNAGGDVNKLAALWPSAPDVSDAFR